MEIDKNPQEAARRMIKDGVPLGKVARMTRLSEDILQEIAAMERHLPNTVAPQNPPPIKFPYPGVS